MCIAIVKPKGAKFPTTQQFKNCFDNNRDGAGFMYSDGESLIIKKGFMTFKNFISAFEKENIPESKLVFFHFRIATKGLIDGGNTHPFPVTDNIKIQRKTDLKFKGYGLIHNGVINFDKSEYQEYDPKNIASDTMLFALKLSKSLAKRFKRVEDLTSAVAYHIATKNNSVSHLITTKLSYNKVAIMNEKEEFVKYGNWVYNNGVYYSNHDFEENNYWNNYYDDYYGNYYETQTYDADEFEKCIACLEWFRKSELKHTTSGYCCNTCVNLFQFHKCKKCDILMFTEDYNDQNICDDCLDKIEYCEECGEPLTSSIVTGDEHVLCEHCYSLMV